MVTAVQSQLNLDSSDSSTRISSRLNTRYQRVCAELGIQVAQRVINQASGAATTGSPQFTWTGMEKLERVYWLDANSNPQFLDEISFEDLRRQEEQGLDTSDEPTEYAVQLMGASSITIRVNKKAETTYTLRADGLDTTDTLSGSQVPQLPTNFHYILVEGAMSDELRKMQRVDEAGIAEAVYEKGLSKLRLFLAKSGQLSWVSQQGRGRGACERCGYCG
jgi:hypothetical protein